MKKNFWDKRIPTLFGILLITLGIGITTFLVNQGVLFKSNASLTDQPQNVRITNITDSSFSVSYETESKVMGSLNYGEDQKLGKSALDDRDQQTGNLTPYNVHAVTVRNLNPEKKYFFSITSGQETFINSDQPFEVTTGLKLSESPPNQNPISGKILLSDGNSPKEAIVYVTADNSQVISTLVKSDGSYILPLNSLRTNDFATYYSFPPNGNVKMLVFGDSLISNILLSLSQTSPIPTIMLSKNYDFRESQSPVTTLSGSLVSFPIFTSTSSASSPQILTPKNNQELTDQQPLFKGTSAPDQNVKIIIRSDQVIQTTVKADQNGNWSYRPPANLSPGTHTITIQANDASGILKTITQSFVVYAAGQQINPPPSGTPTPTVSLTPTKIPSPTVSLSPTRIPSPTVASTISVIPSITLVPSVTQIQTKSGIIISPAKKPLPPTGNPSIMTAGIVGAVVTLVGGLLFLLTRGGIQAL